MMKYVVIYPNGKVMAFYVKTVAEMYALINNGTLVEEEVQEVENV